jgi:deazaflavin-dependent oxidoreductase (nitroreductase family)
MARKVVIAAITGLLVFVVGPALFERLAPRRWVVTFQRAFMALYRPLAGVVPGWAVVETTGRRTGRPRQTPVGGRLRLDTFWLVAGDRSRSQYVKNIEADPTVRVRARGRWRTGTAHVLVHDDARHRLRTMNPINSAFIWIAGTDPATVRIDLDPDQRSTAKPPAL